MKEAFFHPVYISSERIKIKKIQVGTLTLNWTLGLSQFSTMVKRSEKEWYKQQIGLF